MRKPMVRICVICGGKFVSPGRPRKTCSPACLADSYARLQQSMLDRTGEPYNRWLAGMRRAGTVDKMALERGRVTP